MINLWATCLRNEDCLTFIAGRASALASTQLVLQVKAEDLLERPSIIARLRRDKVRIALSGIRAAASVTASMQTADLEFIKVDRDVMGQGESERLRTLQAIAAAGRQIDVPVIAEGVDALGQYRAVGRARIDLAQGFFLGKAVPAGQLPGLFERLDWWHGKHDPTSNATAT